MGTSPVDDVAWDRSVVCILADHALAGFGCVAALRHSRNERRHVVGRSFRLPKCSRSDHRSGTLCGTVNVSTVVTVSIRSCLICG
jgi:hypothetical protein